MKFTFFFRAPQFVDGGIEWPPYSPDLNPCDYSFWANLKSRVSRRNPNTLPQLEGAINEAMGEIPIEHIRNAIEALPERLRKLQNSAGDRFF